MEIDRFDKLPGRSVAFAAAAAVTLSALFTGTPVSHAEPYGDDDDAGTSQTSDDGGGMSESGGGMNTDEPSGGGMNTDEPSGGGMESPGGGMEEPGGGMNTDESPGGGMNTDEPSGGGMGEPSGGGGMNTDESPGGGMNTDEPSGGGMGEPSGGGGMNTDEPGGGGMMQPSESEAPAQDVATAKAAAVVSASSVEATSEEISSYRESIESTFTSSSFTTSSVLSSPVTQWNSRWLSYDPLYRPVFTNPYQIPLQVMYDYGGKPQLFTVPPLQRAALDVPTPARRRVAGCTRPASRPASDVSVGSFSGGGFQPAPGQAPPQKPAGLKTIKNALVQVKFASGTSDPFRVSLLNDLGKDDAVSGATKVLLDGEVPAWGQWVKSGKGEDMFQITETQLLPGVKPPAQDPLPGYKIKLAAAQRSSTSWLDQNKTLLIGVGAGAGLLALAAIGFALARRRGSAD